MKKEREKKTFMEKLDVINPVKGIVNAADKTEKIVQNIQPKKILKFYGILDIAILIYMIVQAIKLKNPNFLVTIFLFTPNTIMFIMSLCMDSSSL